MVLSFIEFGTFHCHFEGNQDADIKFTQSTVLKEPVQAAEYCTQNLSINFIGPVRIKKL